MYILWLDYICNTEVAHHLAGVKLDVTSTKKSEIDENMTRIPVVPPHPTSAQSTETRTPSGKTRATSASMPQIKTPATLKTFDLPLQPLVCIAFISRF